MGIGRLAGDCREPWTNRRPTTSEAGTPPRIAALASPSILKPQANRWPRGGHPGGFHTRQQHAVPPLPTPTDPSAHGRDPWSPHRLPRRPCGSWRTLPRTGRCGRLFGPRWLWKHPPWPFATKANLRKAKAYRGSQPPHAAADDCLHGPLVPVLAADPRKRRSSLGHESLERQGCYRPGFPESPMLAIHSATRAGQSLTG
jgi:hypothetical protein